MARIFPDIRKSRIVFTSSAEEKFYTACQKLSAGWHVYYSVTLSTVEKDEGIKDNEIDFVCYHPKFGIVVIEVKGGRIDYNSQDGAYSSINRHGERFRIKDPFEQSLVWKNRFVRFLRKHNIRVPVSHAVCFPSAEDSDFSTAAGIVTDIIIGRSRMGSLENSLKDIAKKSHPPRYLDFRDVAFPLEKILIGKSYTTRLYLREYLDSHEHRVKDIETIHETLVTPIASSRRLGIEGEAGTGKTMLAAMLARHFRGMGQSVLLLSSNSLLNLQLRKDLGKEIDVRTYPELAGSFGINLLIPPKDFEGKREDWVQYEAPEKLKAAVTENPKRYSVVICDEAQDVQPFWWEAIEGLLDTADPERRFYLFFDRSQGVFGSAEDHFVAEEVLPVSGPYFPLVHNYRTTREIATFSRAFRTGNQVLQSHCGRLGYVPKLIGYSDVKDAKRKLADLVCSLSEKEHISSTEMTIISARNPAARESILYGMDTIADKAIKRLIPKASAQWADVKTTGKSIGVATIAGFKGMETPVGILINLSEYNLPIDNPIMASLTYVACTRAKHMLYIFVKEDDPKYFAFKDTLNAIKTTGSIVLEGSSADFEFCGTVTHYDPDRLGWMKVEDPAFEQGSIMFFPHDIRKSNLDGVGIGSKIKFRPRVEGHITIASDLALAQNF